LTSNPDEAPVTTVSVPAFRMERHPVTNQQFRRFVEDTGYLTVAERPLDPADFPGADLESLLPGGLVFTPTSGPVPLNDWTAWWHWRPGARWSEPGGPGTGLDGRERHPVVLVAYEDALAYARWAAATFPPKGSSSSPLAAAARAPCTPGATSPARAAG
jgi:formylglycine-generating enzyme required for sulfatase activity